MALRKIMLAISVELAVSSGSINCLRMLVLLLVLRLFLSIHLQRVYEESEFRGDPGSLLDRS